ncbi:MAG TPA: replicative DNA helicase [Candidatus Limnocylindria bacterium]|nr:replicative DNA helicase [Candidatus Limnocylindria bacterium]
METDFQRPTRVREDSRLDRLPPHSIEAEKGVIGCLLLAPNEGLGFILERSRNAGDVFYDLRHKAIFETLVVMYDSKAPIDLITLGQKLRDTNQLEGVGGLVYLSALMDAVPSAANLAYYLDIVREKYVMRKLLSTCTETIGRIYEHQGELDPLLDQAERDILQIGQEREGNAVRPMKDLVHSAIDVIQSFHERAGGLTGISSGFVDLDKMTSGLHAGEMVVIAARPSMGKTSLAMNIAEHVAIEQKLPVGVFSLEMTADSLVQRMLCSLARVNGKAVRDGFMSEGDFRKLTTAASKLSKAPLYVDDTSGLSILQLRARARRMWQQHGIKLFVIDYLQLLNSTSRKASDNRQQEVSEISGGIKGLAKELSLPIVVLCQLNREFEKEKNRKPRLSDLRESGAIEQDADLVGLLYKPQVEEDEEEAQPEGAGGGIPVNLLIAKQRNGPTGDINLTFLKSYTRYETASRIQEAT